MSLRCRRILQRAVQHYKAPLWLIWVAPFVLQTCTTVGLVGYLSLRNGQEAVNDLAGQLLDKTSQQVDEHLNAYMTLPIKLTKMNLKAIANGDLNLKNPQMSERYFWRQAMTFPQLSFVGYTLPTGYELGAGRWINGLDVALYENIPGANNSSDYLHNTQGNRTQRLWTYNYESNQQPWYHKTVKAGRLIWSEVEISEYSHLTVSQAGQALQTDKNISMAQQSYVAIGASAPFYDDKNQLLGVISTDFMLTQLSDFLRTVKLSQGSKVFITEHTPQGELIATSSQYPIFYREGDKTKRHSIFNSPDPLTRAIAPHLTSHLRHSTQHQTIRFITPIQGQNYYVQVTHWRDTKHDLDWLVVVSVPKSDFMGRIEANTRQTVGLCAGALVLSILCGLLTARWVTQPIASLQQAAQTIAGGNLNQQVEESAISEMSAVGRSFNQMANQLNTSFTQMEYLASHDQLTGLLNRMAFRQQLAVCMKQYITGGHPELQPQNHGFAVLFLDLDFFKLVNDSFGHPAGDQLLIEVSQRLEHCIRRSDTLARFGGDEFVILLDPIETVEQVTQVAERILVALKQPFLLGQNTTFISASIGIALGQEHGEDAESFLRNADIALYQAKAKGKAIYEIFDDAMHTQVCDRLQMETELRQLLEGSDAVQESASSQCSSDDRQSSLMVYYQPIVDAQTLALVGAEALVRWHHPERGWISPGQFIPIAEETGLIVPLGYWILQQACYQIVQWRQQFPVHQELQVNVNLSTRQFLQPDLVDRIVQILQQTQVSPSAVKLEITESLLMSDRPSIQQKLLALRDLGLKISLDDFGTGYSSLSYLQHFRLDTLKIDQSFVQQLNCDASSCAVVETIASLAHKLGMTVVAEGVETQEQLDSLRRMAICEQIQGFLIAPAVPAEQIQTWMTAPSA